MADNRKYAQVQYFTLAGSGAALGAGSVILSSLKDIDGNLLTMASFGTKGYGTLEPGAKTQEEQISFTGITQNVNGTATLTGVSHVDFLYPYTETANLQKSHGGGTKFIISNTSGFYNTFANKFDDETISQVWTFATGATPLITDQPVSNLEAANKLYVDSVAIAGAPDASNVTKGITKLSVAAAVPANPIAVGDNDPRVNNTVATGHTGLVSGTSGGILGFTGATTIASSVVLTANALILGGGVGATPVPLGSLGTISTVLHGNAGGAPSFGAVSLTTDVSGILPVANGGTNSTVGLANTVNADETQAAWHTVPVPVPLGASPTNGWTYTYSPTIFGNGWAAQANGGITGMSTTGLADFFIGTTNLVLTFNVARTYKIKFSANSITPSGTGINMINSFIGFGENSIVTDGDITDATTNRIGVAFYNGQRYAVACNGATITATLIGAYSAKSDLYEIIVNGSTNAEIWINGILVATLTTNLPTVAQNVLIITSAINGGGGGGGFQHISPIIFSQKLS